MADIKQIQFKRTKEAGKRPTTAQIAEGELAINLTDRTLFTNNGTQIIDLGFAKGGNIDGNVVQIGNYTQTGNYDLSGTISVGAAATFKNEVQVTGELKSNTGIISNNGNFRSRAVAGQTSHYWFEGSESGSMIERAVLYAASQTSSYGDVTLRVRNGYNQSGPNGWESAVFSFRGTGEFVAKTATINGTVAANLVNSNKINTSGKNNSVDYSFDDLASWTHGGSTGRVPVNYVYRGRAAADKPVWHVLLDSTSADEYVISSGNATDRAFSLRSIAAKGDAWITNSLAVGGTSYSGLGPASIAIGDNDTGFRGDGDGAFSVIGNSRQMLQYIATSPTYQIWHKRQTNIAPYDGNNVVTMAVNNSAVLSIETGQGYVVDSSIPRPGDGQTYFGYNASGVYNHYLRGTGTTFVETNKGLTVTEGNLTVNKGASFAETVILAGGARITTDRAVEWVRNTDYAQIRFQSTKVDDPDTFMEFRLGDNGKEYYKFTSVAGSTFTTWATLKDGIWNTPNGFNITGSYGDINLIGPGPSISGSNDGSEWTKYNMKIRSWWGLGFADHQDNTRMLFDSRLGVLRIRKVNATHAFSGGMQAEGTIDAGYIQAPNMEIVGSGTLSFSKSGANPRNMRIFHAGAAERGNRLEIADEAGYLAYFERSVPGAVQLSLNGALNVSGATTVNGGLLVNSQTGLTVASTAGDAISWGNANAALSNDGNLRGTRWSAFGNSTWLGDALNWVNNQNVAKAGDTMTGVLTMNNNININDATNRGISLGAGSGTGIFYGADAAGNDWANIEIRSWYGVGFKNTQNSGAAYYNKNTVFMNLRDGTLQAYNVYIRSDKAYKEDIEKIESATDKVEKINGYTYRIKDANDRTRTVGVIAQEVQEVLPEAVTKDTDGKLQVNYNGVIALLVNSVKELTARVKELESK